jgi:hypothetical protein
MCTPYTPVVLARSTTLLSLTALARIAERYVREHGPADAQDALDHVALAANLDRERAEAGIRLALVGRRLVLDKGAVLRCP